MRLPLFVIAGSTLVMACTGGDRTYDLQFQALVKGQPLRCGQTYTGIGTSASTLEIREAKLYIDDPVLVRADGTTTPLVLEQDDRYQRDRIALLDFDDSTGKCAPADVDTRTIVRGTAADDDYVGLRFEIGVPEEMNHLDAATAPAPLNQPGMWWSWKGGYKYMRIDVATRANPSYYLHMGATSCEGSLAGGYTCAAGNVPVIELDGFDPASSKVTFDLGELWAGLDVDQQIDFRSDFVQGCMAFAGDPECPAVFAKLGLNIDGSRNAGQTLFKVAP
jgi:uncharacterized repeat protein (TIGR04052 family)